MRETLHQLDHLLALALPLAVSAVWIVRGDPAGVRATQTATAYRAELAELPLPDSDCVCALRASASRTGSASSGNPRIPIARRRRAALPESWPRRSPSSSRAGRLARGS